MAEELKTLGHSTPRIDGLQRVTGRATYSADVQLLGMLYARVLRSPHPHARILRIDLAKALSAPGVKAILTHENCRLVWSSGDRVNKRYLFNNPVRFVGDAVAAVAATNRHLAEEALKLISVEYEVLDFVLDAEEALQPGATEIHPGGNLSPIISFRSTEPGKREPSIYMRGDVERGFAASDFVFEDRYVSKHVNNAQMEPRVAPIPWQLPHVERMLVGQRITTELAGNAGQAAVSQAQPLAKNGYKIPLTEALVRRTLLSLAG